MIFIGYFDIFGYSTYKKREGREMVKLFFRRSGKTEFVEISPETHERFRLYSYKCGLSLGQVTEMIYGQFGDVSEEILVRFFKLISEREKNKRICTKENPFVPSKKENEFWEHLGAYQTDPSDYDGSFPNFHCPNCGIDFTLDWR